ncbi:Twin-arginine translocation protein TatC [Bathymodiolus thermophilus thioautotrophic gill symbiont]|jgi:sec-independent protein translocase protein TatC|uniref:Sec-independent protein translocase protein TatC n=3 Tax=sulfur-oxidizing symbionts TaxID=32036 RepID=A0A1H6JF23_9GAMM|nr:MULTISPECIES: twin-arginine translocase subunit TatC [Gammaproteobacteria]CAC9494529.1 Twin-arginine translocation protein TatC [uncultured Gammaproteobacteria bacterium]CAB5501871.1 Twin-arginine translocation protein TatC [Bathymodiolus thermophilus thioautotrophic gill symbiont]CAB5507662.1 Twin-arginine translocation protein TatC [Bathymodiolus azoricus thioautotrophic gill symbiont]CAC9507980.1 Twin-arginine translocation protein TatC [uncultured Gammaproteobacteria bacterium]CAC958206
MSTQRIKQDMTFIQHLVELRDKLLHSVIAILLVFAGIFPFANEVYSFIAAPILNVLPSDSNIIAIGVISPFLTPLKMALIFSVYATMPFLLYQVWSFIAPALYKHEKQMILPLVISSTVLFYAGLLFSFYIVFPVIFGFLSSIGPSIVDFTPDIQYYLDFVLKVSFAFGVAFEVPIATILLIIFGVTTVEKLKKNRPYIVIGAFVLGMLLTPPDIISQTLIAVPMWLLFEAGLIFAPMFKRSAPTSDDKDADANSTTSDKEEATDEEDWGDEELDKIDEEFKKLNKEN